MIDLLSDKNNLYDYCKICKIRISIPIEKAYNIMYDTTKERIEIDDNDHIYINIPFNYYIYKNWLMFNKINIIRRCM